MKLFSSIFFINITLVVFYLSLFGQRHQEVPSGIETSNGGAPRHFDSLITTDSSVKFDADTLRSLNNTAFSVGEKLDYDISYGIIVAGSATISVPSFESYNDRKCYKVEFTMHSAKFFDLFFKVRDYYSSLIDVTGLFPWKFEQHIREGGYKKDFEAWFDQQNHTAKTSEGGPVRYPGIYTGCCKYFFLCQNS